MSLNRKKLIGLALVGTMVCLGAGLATAAHHEGYPTTPEDWEKQWNADDAAGVAALYAEDGWAGPPGLEAVQGREAIQAMLEQDIANNEGNTLHIDVVEQSAMGEHGVARGVYKVTDADGNTIDKGKWIEVRKMVDGKWYIQWDIWNSDMAPGLEHQAEHEREVEHQAEHEHAE